MLGKNGTSGALNALGKSGCVLLITITATATSANADNVPIFTRCAKTFKSINPEISAAIIPVVHVFKNGVLNFG